MNRNGCRIALENVSLVYDLYYDRTTSLKEYLINLLSRRKYVEERVGKLSALRDCTLTIGHGERVGLSGSTARARAPF